MTIASNRRRWCKRMAEPVNENLCAERMKVQDERFARDLERIKALEDT